ncbi:uncharacterized protein LOC111336388 [Stylophora pistillata]|uniref:uncharacterized protein LOC111336388 n=1 Tax=Stylophora pistillata TaxID=50429 RepID=UPI000C03E00E|nr:uncharacterized protein LOC111336388 [Stylophora pistillata]
MEEEVGNREHEGQHYRELGDSSFKLKDYKQAIENYELSLSIAREGGNRVAEGELYKSLGESYHGLDDYKQALQYYELSLGIAREGGNRVAEGQLYKNLGDSNCLLMDYKQAIMYYGLSLGIAKERGDRVEEGRMCKSLGDFYYGLGDYKQALQYYELSLYNVKEKGNRHLEGELYNSLGNVYEELKDYKQAIENYELSLSIAMEVADRTWQKELYENLGYVYTNLEDFKQAIQHYEHSLSIAKEEGDSTDEKALSKSLGDSYYSLCDYKQAIQYYEQYLRIANKVGRGVIERRVYKNLIACYESLEEHTQAIEYEEQLFSVAEEGMKGKGKETRHLQLNDLQFIGEVKEEEIVKQPHSHDMQVPPEIKGRGLRAELAYRKALQFGKVKVYHARIMLIGQDRAGKTSLKKSLLGLPFDLEEQSTVGIEVDRSSFKVEVDQVKNWQRTAKKEGVSQFAKELARIVAGDLKNEEAKMDLTPQRELKETRSHKTQVGELDVLKPVYVYITHAISFGFQESRNKSHKRREKDTLANHQSAPETPQSSIDASTPPEEFTEHLIQYLTGLNLKGDSSSTEPVVDVDVWDLAGQHLYYASHPVFFSMRALYLLVYNLSKGLNNTADPFVRQGIHDIRLENPNGETNLENLLSWLASVAAISPTQQEAGEAETPYLRPPVLMVGTHADKPFQDIKEMKIQIQKELSGKGFARHVNTQFFSIDNTQSLSDAGVIKLREEILKVLELEPYMGEEVPVRWFNFEKVVQALKGNHTFYLNIKYLQAIVKEVCFVKDETELGVMLDFYHDLGVVVKHGSTVVLQAQWLIDLFKQLITIPRYEEVGLESRLLQKWKHLEETGILCMELVRHVFSKFIKEDSVAEKDILDMMERFGLVAKFVTSTQNSVQYFVPAQLKSLPKDQDLCKWEASTSDPCPLYLDFLNGFVPHGIFYQLVSRCISWCSENGFKRLPTLYCHAARFFIVKNFIHPLTLLCKRRYIKIILKHREPVSEECFAEGREVAKDLRNFLKSTLQDMAQQIPWRGNLKCELCVECPFCPIERKPCQNHGKISCTHEECFCLLNMAPAERLLCEKSFCDKVPTIPGLDEWFSMEDKNLKKREETVSRGDISTYGSLKSGPPSCAELQDLANEIQESWQQIGRRLKLCEENLSSINFEEESVYEKSYRMLRKWTEAFHYSANYGTLAQALEHELVDRGDLARKYCYTKHPAETPQVVRVDSPFLKDGTPSEDDLQYLASNIFDCWKVLGRQLDLEESVLISIDWEEKRTSEKCYKMLKKWKECNGSEADFKTLAHGLENHLVERNDLAAKYCYITKASEQARRELQTLTQALQTGLNIHTTSGCVERSNPLRDLATTASGKGYKVFPNQGQGNCLFHALSDQLDIVKGIKIEQSDLRRTLVQYLRDNPTLPDGTDLLGFIDNCQSWEDYLTNMQKDGTWGDEVILRAAANNYGTSILVISNLSVANDITITPYQSGEYKRLVLGHVHEFHYVSLRPIEGHSRKRKLDNEEILDENNRLAKLPIAEKNFNEGHSKSGKLEE